MTVDIVGLVTAKIDQLGKEEAAKYFDVSEQTIKNWKEGIPPKAFGAIQKVLAEWMEFHPPEIWDVTGKKVLLLMPIYDSVNGKTVVTLMRNYSLYGRDKVGLIPRFRTLIWEARNKLVDMALKTDSEVYVFLDDDMVLPVGHGPTLRGLGCDIGEPMASNVALTRLLKHPPEYKIVSALAFGRHEGALRAACSGGHDSAEENALLVQCRTKFRDELRPQRWVGFGFTRVHRTVFEAIKAKAEELFPEIIPKREGAHYGYFIPSGAHMGEDAALCFKAKKVGIECYVDCGLPIGHVSERVV